MVIVMRWWMMMALDKVTLVSYYRWGWRSVNYYHWRWVRKMVVMMRWWSMMMVTRWMRVVVVVAAHQSLQASGAS